MFLAVFGLTTYFYATSMMYDPGFVPKLNGIAEQKAVIDELIGLWKFDEANFCVTCMIRTPLRSKHCRRCRRCVAKHDQYVLHPPPPFRLSVPPLSSLSPWANEVLFYHSHCPWVYNCVGVNNHRHFFLYLINLTFGILAYDWLIYYCMRSTILDPASS